MPDLGLAIGGRKTRVAELMRAGRFVLLDLTAGGRVAATAVNWSDPVPIVAEPLSKPAPADALLIRPDGYVAWASGPGDADPAAGLRDALIAWCGAGQAGAG